jgi:ribonuclease R
MHSAQRFTYDTVWEILSNTRGPEAVRFAQFNEQLNHLYQLYKILFAAREKRGAIDFETVETQIISNELGKILRIEPRLRNDAHRLIEECMLTANVCAANFLQKHHHLSLFRVHGEPSVEKVQTLKQVLRTTGLHLTGNEKPHPKDFAKLMKEIKGRPDASTLQMLILRSMQQAIYQPENEGHFGLSYPAYAHFTSPIRRYPDLLVHRSIKAILSKKAYHPHLPEDVPMNLTMPRKGQGRANAAAVKQSQQDAKARAKRAGNTKGSKEGAALAVWAQFGVHCSANERRADEASRDVEAWLKCYYMRDHLGQEYAGTITGVANFGLFVQLESLFVEGMVHVTELGGDYYQYDEARQELRGERTGIRYRIGDRLHVLVSRVDLDARKIEFSLVKANTNHERDGMRFKSTVLANDSGRPSKKAAHKKTRPAEKAPKREATTASKKSKTKSAKTARQPSMGQGTGRKSHKGKRK